MPRQEQGIEYYLTGAGEKRYRVRWEEGGRHRSRSFRRLSGERGARRFYQRVREAQEARSRVVAGDAAELTLAEFVADVWAPKARRRLAGTTWQSTTVLYNRHVLSQLGARNLAEIDAEDLVEWQDERERAGVGAPTMIKAIGILSNVFAEACRRPRSTGVRLNPVALLEKPSAARRRRPLVWGPVVVERVRYQLLRKSLRVGTNSELAAERDGLLIGLMAMSGARPGEALALRWIDVGDPIRVSRALSGDQILERTKTGPERSVPLLTPLAGDLAHVRSKSGDGPTELVFQTAAGRGWDKKALDNCRNRHFVPALQRVEDEWQAWRESLPDPSAVRESVAGLAQTRLYDLGRHTHSALMLASGMTLQRLARIQGHSIRVLDETYSEQLAEYEESSERIDPVEEIEKARALVWRRLDPSTGEEAGSS